MSAHCTRGHGLLIRRLIMSFISYLSHKSDCLDANGNMSFL